MCTGVYGQLTQAFLFSICCHLSLLSVKLDSYVSPNALEKLTPSLLKL